MSPSHPQANNTQSRQPEGHTSFSLICPSNNTQSRQPEFPTSSSLICPFDMPKCDLGSDCNTAMSPSHTQANNIQSQQPEGPTSSSLICPFDMPKCDSGTDCSATTHRARSCPISNFSKPRARSDSLGFLRLFITQMERAEPPQGLPKLPEVADWTVQEREGAMEPSAVDDSSL